MLRIELTGLDGEPIHIDAEKIVMVEAIDTDPRNPSMISMAGGGELIVSQTIDEIGERIDAISHRPMHRPGGN